MFFLSRAVRSSKCMGTPYCYGVQTCAADSSLKPFSASFLVGSAIAIYFDRKLDKLEEKMKKTNSSASSQDAQKCSENQGSS